MAKAAVFHATTVTALEATVLAAPVAAFLANEFPAPDTDVGKLPPLGKGVGAGGGGGSGSAMEKLVLLVFGRGLALDLWFLIKLFKGLPKFRHGLGSLLDLAVENFFRGKFLPIKILVGIIRGSVAKTG